MSSTISRPTRSASDSGPTGERRVPILGPELAAAGQPLETLPDRAHAAGDRRLPDVAQPDRIARHRECLRHARAHRAGPNHADLFDAFDHVMLLRSAAPNSHTHATALENQARCCRAGDGKLLTAHETLESVSR